LTVFALYFRYQRVCKPFDKRIDERSTCRVGRSVRQRYLDEARLSSSGSRRRILHPMHPPFCEF
jgi:hypothetical protein